MKRKVKIIIKGIPWTIQILSEKVYSKKVNKGDEDTHGTTYLNSKEIFVSRDCGDLRHYILHELMHAYIGSCCINTTDGEKLDIEELSAEIVASHIYEIAEQCEYILKHTTKSGSK